MTASRWLAAVLAATAIAAVGCGGDDEEESSGGGTTTEQAPADTGSDTGAPAADGKQLFATTCGGCHTLADAGTSGTTGPNLDDLEPDAATVKAAIAEGPSVMPENLVEGAEADAVADYVAGAAGG